MKLEIVKIGDAYALRRTKLFFYQDYKDLISRFWWSKNSSYFKDCLGSLERVEEEARKQKENKEQVIKRIY